jgi:hypothetical protein
MNIKQRFKKSVPVVLLLSGAISKWISYGIHKILGINTYLCNTKEKNYYLTYGTLLDMGFDRDEITGAKLLVERVVFNLEEIATIEDNEEYRDLKPLIDVNMGYTTCLCCRTISGI